MAFKDLGIVYIKQSSYIWDQSFFEYNTLSPCVTLLCLVEEKDVLSKFRVLPILCSKRISISIGINVKQGVGALLLMRI